MMELLKHQCFQVRRYIANFFSEVAEKSRRISGSHFSVSFQKKVIVILCIWVKLLICLKALWKAICSCRKFLCLTQVVMIALSLQELNQFRGNCSMLYHYDWISVPLVYTQVSCQILSTQMLFHWWMIKHILLLAFLVCVTFSSCLRYF